MSETRHKAALLAVLIGLNFLSFADRYVLGAIQELVRTDGSLAGGARTAAGLLSDASLGALGTAFMVVFVLTSPFAGAAADRVAARWIVAGGGLIWSLATLGSGLAPNYQALVVCRALTGAGEAAYATVAPVLIADLFSGPARGRALGAFFLVMPLGAACGFALGAPVGAAFGWRAALLLAAAPGLLLSVLAASLGPRTEPVRTESPPWRSVGELVRHPTWLRITTSQALMGFTIAGMGAWMPSLLARAAQVEIGRAGMLFGAAAGAAGLLGTGGGIWLAERADARHRDGGLLLSGAALVLSGPLLFAMARAHAEPAMLATAFAGMLLMLVNTAPLNTELVSCVPAHLRAWSVSASIIAVHLTGDAAAPTLVGMASDRQSLAWAMQWLALPVVLAGAVLLRTRRERATDVAVASPSPG